MRCHEVQGVAIPAMDISKLGVAEADGVLQHGLEHRLKIARGTADNMEHLRHCRLLLQGFREFARALLLGLEQPHVLDRDHGLIGEGGNQRDLFAGEGPNFAHDQHNDPEEFAPSQHRNSEK